MYHLLCGEIDAGADWTEKAIAERDPGIMFYLRFTLFGRSDQHAMGPDRQDMNVPNRRPRPLKETDAERPGPLTAS